MEREDQYLTATEAARRVGITAAYMCRLIAKGHVPAIKIGRRTFAITPQDLGAYMRRRKKAFELKAIQAAIWDDPPPKPGSRRIAAKPEGGGLVG